MQIDIDLLYAWGAITKKYKRNDIIFHEDSRASCYFQIITGKVKMYNSNEEGKRFTQGIFDDGCCFGEPPLFINETYPASAEAVEDSIIIKLGKDKFLKIIDEYPKIQREFLNDLAHKVFVKSVTAKSIINQKPEFRITAFFNSLKKNNQNSTTKLIIPFTRQEIADFTGLRVETVIRQLKEMEKNNIVNIIHHKVYYIK